MLQYIRQLRHNHSLSLCQLTLKTVMLLCIALTRLSRSVGLYRLDIKTCTFIASGVIFKLTHLSKQSQTSNPIADIFFLSFNQDTCLCPVETLKAYEPHTLLFRGTDTNTPQTGLENTLQSPAVPLLSGSAHVCLRQVLTQMYSSPIQSEVHHAHQLPGQGSPCVIS